MHKSGSDDGMLVELDGKRSQEIVALVRMDRCRRRLNGAELVIVELQWWHGRAGSRGRSPRWRRKGRNFKGPGRGPRSCARVTLALSADRLIVTRIMPSRQVSKQMQAIAIERVLGRRDDRAGISSLAGLRDAYQSELAVNYAEIEALANAFVARLRQIDASMLAKMLRCAACGDPIKDPQRSSRRYCSARCRQRARRLWLRSSRDKAPAAIGAPE
jgi:hypothetical protein